MHDFTETLLPMKLDLLLLNIPLLMPTSMTTLIIKYNDIQRYSRSVLVIKDFTGLYKQITIIYTRLAGLNFTLALM